MQSKQLCTRHKTTFHTCILAVPARRTIDGTASACCPHLQNVVPCQSRVPHCSAALAALELCWGCCSIGAGSNDWGTLTIWARPGTARPASAAWCCAGAFPPSAMSAVDWAWKSLSCVWKLTGCSTPTGAKVSGEWRRVCHSSSMMLACWNRGQSTTRVSYSPPSPHKLHP